MIYIWLNASAILAATLAGLAFSWIFYRLTRVPVPRRSGFVLTAALAQAWLAAILAGALILAPDEAPRAAMLLLTPVVIWAGFVLPTMVATHRLRGFSLATALLDGGHWLGVMWVQALVLAAIGLVPPPG